MKNRTRYPQKPHPWLYGYGFCGYGYGVGNPDPRYTRAEPYQPEDNGEDGDGANNLREVLLAIEKVWLDGSQLPSC
jgi:hypothetical protein